MGKCQQCGLYSSDKYICNRCGKKLCSLHALTSMSSDGKLYMKTGAPVFCINCLRELKKEEEKCQEK